MTDQKVDATIETLDSLRALLEQDMALISGGAFDGLAAGSRQKLAAAAFIRDELAILLQHLCAKVETHELPNLDELKATLGSLIDLAERHRQCLQGAIEATKQRIQVVIDARQNAYSDQETYGPQAKMRKGRMYRSAMTMRTTNA
jgi:hypothetical protein